MLDRVNGSGYDLVYFGGASNHRVPFRVKDGSGTFQTLTHNTSGLAGGWHHAAVSLDRDGDVVLYVDGVERDREAFNQAATADILGTAAFVGGAFPNATYEFDSRIDDLRVWHEPLLPADVAGAVRVGRSAVRRDENRRVWLRCVRSPRAQGD